MDLTQINDMDEVWTRRAAEGDLNAFNQLVLKHQDLAYRHALSMLSDGWLAEEVVQESFLKAFQHMPDFRGGSFRAWLMRIVTNTTYDVLRQTSKRPTLPLFPDDDDGEEMEAPRWLADPNTLVEEGERVKLIYRTLNELQDIYRIALILVDLQDFDYEEAAQALNVPVGTIKSRLARARMQLKEKLQHYPSAIGNYQSWMQPSIYS
ncbi:MAG TPA: sigma-70 family RNA polymerase sigma factor [Anaerolineales bacterium]|nr:sigma-70 family RNA polymerase sigma factor [Anaerolineales bacterium]